MPDIRDQAAAVADDLELELGRMTDRGDPEDGDLVESPPPCDIPAEVAEAVRTMIRWAGDDPAREGLLDTPRRVARAWREYFKGYAEDPAVHFPGPSRKSAATTKSCC